MDYLSIEGQTPLHGEVFISGAKNAALPILLASILIDGTSKFSNVPNLKDIQTTIKLLSLLGLETEYANNSLTTQVRKLVPDAPYDLVSTMRASALCLGPLLARLGQAKVALPGGCAIGARPIDQHLKALEKMGAVFELSEGNIHGKCQKLKGAHIDFDFVTVGGTENILMAATLAEGDTTLVNAAREPEIVDLANFLNKCGAKIQGQGTDTIHIQGVSSLKACDYTIMPDRIEAGTFLIAAAITNGNLKLHNCQLQDLDAVCSKLSSAGVTISQNPDNSIQAKRTDSIIKPVDITTKPHPGFPTDMQAQMMALLSIAEGSSLIEETIFENRYMHVQELHRLGADIKISGHSALVRGVTNLNAAPVMASDLRASASLVLAALAAKGKSKIQRIYHLDRGYEAMEKKLQNVGARIARGKD